MHTLWLCNKFGQIFLYLWAWQRGGAVGAMFDGTPTFGHLILAMTAPSIVFLQALVLLGQTPSVDRDWEAHFYEHRVRFFVLSVAMILITGSVAVLGRAAVSPLPHLILLALNAVALASTNRRVHAAVACAAAGIVAVAMGIPIAQS